MPIQNSVVSWALDHLHWPFIVGAAWWLRGQISDVKADAAEVKTQVSNHIPTALNDQIKLLTSIDKGIAVLVDRGK